MQVQPTAEQANRPGPTDRDPAPDGPAAPKLAAALGQECAACGAALAAEQRYCLECGERRGPSQLSALQARAPDSSPVPAGRPRPRLSANTALIAGVGTLLLALGIGVLIGRSSQTDTIKPASAVQVVTVPGAAAAGTAATQAPATAAKSKAGGSAAASLAASGATVVKPRKSAPPPTKVVTVGSPGKGPGYQHGHFTGNFFGGG